jgi:hypothetical protein
MSEHLENQESIEQTQSNPFEEGNWVDDNANETENQEEGFFPENNANSDDNQSEEEIIDADEYLQKTLGFENWDVAKEEIEKLRTSGRGKYDNEVSEKIHKALLENKYDDVYSYLESQTKLNKLVSSEISEENAEDIVKLAMKSRYSDLTDKEIEYKFKKQFAMPKEPEQSFDETDDEFEERTKEWEEKVNDVKMELLIEAKTSRSQIEKLKSEIKLPDISQENGQNKNLSQEELEQVQKYVSSYLQSVDSSVNSFEGFNVDYKDNEVSLRSAYVPSSEEKQVVANQLKTLAENDFNANAIFAERWVNEDGSLRTERMARDLALLHSEEKIMQKLVNDGITKRLAEYRKSTSNIKVNGGQSNKGTFNPEGGKQSMAEFFFGA